MRSISHGFRAYLAALSAVTTATAQVRISAIDQSVTGTFIVVTRMGTEHFDTLGAADDSLLSEMFRVVVYDDGADVVAHTLADSIAETLDDFTGAMGSDRVVQNIFFPDESGDYTPPEFVDGRFMAELMVTIQHSPAS